MWNRVLTSTQKLGDIDCTDKLDLSSLVPTYIKEIPADSKNKNSIENDGSGYVIYGSGYMVIKKNDNTLGIYAKVPENNSFLAIGVTEEGLQEPPATTLPGRIEDLGINIESGNINLSWSTPNNNN